MNGSKTGRQKREEKVFLEVCARIEHCHELGYLYMDLKPEHILVGENDQTWLIDFNAIIPIGSTQVILSNELAVPPENGLLKLNEQADFPGLGTIHRLLFGPSNFRGPAFRKIEINALSHWKP